MVLEERCDFILRKLWYWACEEVGRVSILVHDESWINEKPSGVQVWSTDIYKPGKKVEGRRFAFSGLWSLDEGIVGKPRLTAENCGQLIDVIVSVDELVDPR